MDAGQDGGGTPAEWRSVMIDLSGSALADLVATDVAEDDDSALAHALRRVTAELERPGEPIAGFNSAI
ncbi:FxSxx-COOH cyclophane-containing RiPP peptide [Actinoplanes sp. DH11]|uniref:FxSxx-COOH cyclophane-containing RiPP peptide n=1 Tax=Actinoplanes sp. DH11 TaxID=2857011 RepID=UPI001E45A639|nr:FxSxx-COOH cyclophane-containing RiPP peptide [Actinoplanes sp. DH11]